MSRPNLQMQLSMRGNNFVLEFKPTRFRNCFLASPNCKARKRHYLFGVLTRACSVMIYRSAFRGMVFGKFILRFCFAWCLPKAEDEKRTARKAEYLFKNGAGNQRKAKRWKNCSINKKYPFAMPNKSDFTIPPLNRICNKSE